MERKIRQVISIYLLQYLFKIFCTIIISLVIINLYTKYSNGIFPMEFKTSVERTFGIFILTIVFYSYRFYDKVDNIIIKDLENIIHGIKYDYFKDGMNTLEFRMIQETLMDKNRKISEKESFINSSLSYISHDMKTPITIINANINLLKSTKKLVDKDAERLCRIEQEANKISDYIDNLMDVTSSFYKNDKREKIKITDLLVNIKKNIELYSDLMEEGIQYYSAINDDDAYIIANINKLQKSFAHLLNNAYEHKKEKIEVQIKLEHDSIIIEVIDDGIGFNNESIKKAKEIFYTDNYGRTTGKGYGIGLYFVNSYVESLGGKLILKNEDEGGAVQSMQIPMIRSI